MGERVERGGAGSADWTTRVFSGTVGEWELGRGGGEVGWGAGEGWGVL